MRRSSRRALAYLTGYVPLPDSAAIPGGWRECEHVGRNDFDARAVREVPCDD
jgi:hypothetical protein